MLNMYICAILKKMKTLTKTLKLPFLNLNIVKAQEFSVLAQENCTLANEILSIGLKDRRKLTSKSFPNSLLNSSFVNQTIRNVLAKKTAKTFKRMPLETNNQNWDLVQVGSTWSIVVRPGKGSGKRIPLAVHASSHNEGLTALADGLAQKGSLKLVQSRKGIGYACLSVSLEVPETEKPDRWVGVDRGQNIPAVVSTPDGPVLFLKAGQIKHLRRTLSQDRKSLQKEGKHKTLKAREMREHRRITHVNHLLSKQIVALAKGQNAGIRLEDLSGIRKNARQRRSTKTDAGLNRDYWPFYQLETFISYKALAAGVFVEKVPAAYTSKTCHNCRHLGDRRGKTFSCTTCGYKAHADAVGAMNVRDWEGAYASLLVSGVRACSPGILEASPGGLYEPALNPVHGAPDKDRVSA